MRLIDADALIMDRIETEMASNEMRLYISKNQIDHAPTVDVVPVVHGHWEIVPNDENKDGYYQMRCSVCGSILWSIEPEELYCCKCGAKMDECADGETREE